MTTHIDDAVFLTWLKRECDHRDSKPLGDGRYASILLFMFTVAIVTGKIGDYVGYEDRWCFQNYAKAKAALDAWDGSGEPDGWHRHPDSGRRRVAGDVTTEYVTP